MKIFLKKSLFFVFILIYSTSLFGEVEQEPLKKKEIVLLGAVPVLSSFIFVLKRADLIHNDLSMRFQNGNMSNIIYENMTHAKEEKLPMYGFDNDINIELLLKNNPNYIFTMDKSTAYNLSNKGFNTIALAWRNEEDVEKNIFLLADLLDAKEEAKNYINYTNYVTNTIQNKIKAIPIENRPKVLCFDYKTMSSLHHIIDSWVEKSGGISVTKPERVLEKISFSQEQILVWNPDIIILSNPNDVETLYKDKRFASISAIKNKKVFVSPLGIHIWIYRTAELPLMELWAAKTFYPKIFHDIDMKKESLYFYNNLVGYEPTSQELDEILNPSQYKKE